MSATRVLCVDDEPQVIDGLVLSLGRSYEVQRALGGAEGLVVLRERGPFAVVLSDMRMPGMDGATFLAQVRQCAPDTTRMLLTGHADLEATIQAVNEGQIFRFLSKPCPPDALRKAFAAAAEQHRLVTGERVLLEETLHGSIKALVDVLSLTNPIAFGRATRIKQHVSELAVKLRLPERWQVEVAAMLSQLSSIVLPPETVEKVYFGGPLTAHEADQVARLPAVTERLLAHIPRLEVVRGILATYGKSRRRPDPAHDDADGVLVERGAQLLKIAVDFDVLEAQGNPAGVAVGTMRGRAECYDPEIFEAFAALRGADAPTLEVREVPVAAIREGMVFAEDVKLATGTLLAARGYEVTASFVERARNFRPGFIKEPVRVILRGAPGDRPA